MNMQYTVKQLAELSGVSSRTLRHYDDIGLLKPAFYGQNGYRYYEKEQLLLLQQVLFYRELGIPLIDIKRIVESDDFDKLEAMQSHKKRIQSELKKHKQLIKTIDKTIEHLRGNLTMKDDELYYGFDSETQKQHERTLVKKGIISQEFLDESKEKTKSWSNKQKQDFINQIEKIMSRLIAAIEDNQTPDSKLVQDIMKDHYYWLCKSWCPDSKKYAGLAKLYQTPDFSPFFDKRHPKLLDFIVKAMQVYAENWDK